MLADVVGILGIRLERDFGGTACAFLSRERALSARRWQASDSGGTHDVEPKDLDAVVFLALGRLLFRIKLFPLVC